MHLGVRDAGKDSPLLQRVCASHVSSIPMHQTAMLTCMLQLQMPQINAWFVLNAVHWHMLRMHADVLRAGSAVLDHQPILAPHDS